MKHLVKHISAAGLVLTLGAGAARAGDNDLYGEVRINSLPKSGQASKGIWPGSWWAYTRDGIAYRLHDDSVDYYSYGENYARWDSKDNGDLSPAEKLDKAMGRYDKIEFDKLKAHGQKVDELRDSMDAKITEQRDLVRKLNRAIAANPSLDWRTTDDGKRYLAVGEELKGLQTQSDALVPTAVDTATEYEILNHGSQVYGVQGWYGHCNAWSAAAIVEPEPRQNVTVNGVEFTPGDVKALLTESWMEINSSFYGTRNEDHDSEEGRKGIDYRDVTPAAFHILFADQIGKRDKAFVIDRFTGSEVWNQPVTGYRSKLVPLYTDTTAMERDVVYTTYGSRGASETKRAKQKVFPVLVTTTFQWVTDGLPHETLAVPLSRDIDDATFADANRIEELYAQQIEIRTVTYELWLDKPLTDVNAKIVGDGAWQHGAGAGYEHLHPDFIWQPLANVNNSRDYENELVDYKFVKEKILPGALQGAAAPTSVAKSFAATGVPVAIPDNAPAGASAKINVTDALNVGVLTVDVDITHTYIGDLQVSLTNPAGKVAVLKAYSDGGSKKDLKKTFDVKDFNGMAAQGMWTLSVIDNAAQDAGSINGVKLNLK